MDKSKKLQRKQKTQYRDQLMEVEVELQGKSKVPSNSRVLPNRESVNDGAFDTSRLLEEVLERNNMLLALKRVISNKGSHGVDGMKTDELREHIKKHWETIKVKLLESKYNPSPVRRKEISKPDGGVRLLGIPTVQDRLIQQAIAQVLSKIYEPLFSENSFGFRPHRGAKDAITKSKQYITQGNRWVIDMDLEKFFDKVNHDILMNKLEKKIQDKRLLSLIRKYLKSGILINGVSVASEEGTPQGGPLSPLLANIMLDELDKELERRGYKFCRYADDNNIYVKSKRAGFRVMKSITNIIENNLKLKVNKDKSAVDFVSKRKFLGFSFYFSKSGAEIRIHEKSIKKFKEKVKFYTNRNKGISMEYRLHKLNQITKGWINYYGIANARGKLIELDKWIRRRLRACIWKQWKKISTKQRNLAKLGIDKYKAWEYANTRKGYWRISKSPILSKSLNNKYLESLGFISLTQTYQMRH
ncbi:group II intron reverse transcriptase/maturase [Clostridium saccharoperbutylacetonicum]|uniref:group II intron reverse transcriptase/maturase n=1 Tax=Clostridium saccharoperbutylacetonicum TaxID=36745 RepID=UPI00156D8DF0|nr:group II intron reverse transcriptase/maturase [Clostridium saccharoperbutylacetonicum]NRT63395.1 group II intron reverse transcriptase/maturase [Clostridium saccharoperbutylacetonicum]NSB26757.1 group II intron reverse transcriptase/maturase [Clostridium saccharoperbutylacetonicum]NSB46109.1 group II intron reverse transcriptase/maturase [Clostridium saccharoperbutylacetonicum]